jgi:hypothetical protein
LTFPNTFAFMLPPRIFHFLGAKGSYHYVFP